MDWTKGRTDEDKSKANMRKVLKQKGKGRAIEDQFKKTDETDRPKDNLEEDRVRMRKTSR